MAHTVALTVEIMTTVLAVAGMGYYLAALLAAYGFLLKGSPKPGTVMPGVSILKSLKGLDPGMLDAFRSHCRQEYAGEYELLFGVASLDDPAVAAVKQLQAEFPERSIRLVECPLRLGTNGKVSTLVQLEPHAHYPYLLINDSDITVGPRYLQRVMAWFEPDRGGVGGVGIPPLRDETAQGWGTQGSSFSMSPKPGDIGHPESAGDRKRRVGLVTALYRGRAHGTLGSRLEAMGIAMDFQPSVLLSRWLERGLKYGLGSTLAVSREALAAIGGLNVLVDHLADDYELGARVYAAGYSVALSKEPVETSVPAYDWQGFIDHQLRWFRTVRDARPGGYVGLVFTHGLMWAVLNAVASGLSPLSLWLLAMSFFLRLTLAMTVGANVLRDHQVLPSLWLLPLRDAIAMGLWVTGFAGNTIVWRGERFVVHKGKLTKA